jgi:hypothetical protein
VQRRSEGTKCVSPFDVKKRLDALPRFRLSRQESYFPPTEFREGEAPLKGIRLAAGDSVALTQRLELTSRNRREAFDDRPAARCDRHVEPPLAWMIEMEQ